MPTGVSALRAVMAFGVGVGPALGGGSRRDQLLIGVAAEVVDPGFPHQGADADQV